MLPLPFHACKQEKEKYLLFSAKILFKMRFISGQYKRPWTWAQFLCGDISPATLHKKKLLTAWFSSASVHFTNCWRKIPRKSKGNITQNGFASKIYKLHSLPLFLDILIKFVWKLWENHQSIFSTKSLLCIKMHAPWSKVEVELKLIRQSLSTVGFIESIFLFHVCVPHLNSSIL